MWWWIFLSFFYNFLLIKKKDLHSLYLNTTIIHSFKRDRFKNIIIWCCIKPVTQIKHGLNIHLKKKKSNQISNISKSELLKVTIFYLWSPLNKYIEVFFFFLFWTVYDKLVPSLYIEKKKIRKKKMEKCMRKKS